jgi:hypothetical protein
MQGASGWDFSDNRRVNYAVGDDPGLLREVYSNNHDNGLPKRRLGHHLALNMMGLLLLKPPVRTRKADHCSHCFLLTEKERRTVMKWTLCAKKYFRVPAGKH